MKVKVKIDGIFLSCLFRKGTSAEAIVFIHGLGSSKEDFSEAFRRDEFQPFTVLAADLVGFGDSDKPADFSYAMKEQAKILKKTMDRFGVGQFHLVAHGMGGIIGIELCEMMPFRVVSFINAEGNLTSQDATMSREVAAKNEDEFAQYLEALSKATVKSVYQSVYESDHGDLLTRFTRLPFYKCYLYGEKNKGRFLTERLLGQKRIPVFYISGSGHAMTNDNPAEFYDRVLKTIRRFE